MPIKFIVLVIEMTDFLSDNANENDEQLVIGECNKYVQFMVYLLKHWMIFSSVCKFYKVLYSFGRTLSVIIRVLVKESNS
jgi:hypothetical protein